MLMAVLCSSLIGAVLGIRFKVQVLFLVVPFAFVATAGIVAVAQSAFQPALLAAIAAARLAPKRPLRSTTTVQG